MPKFISGSSGHIYSHDKLAQEEDELLAVISNPTSQQSTSDTQATDKKPSAINNKGVKERQKSSLDLFKEELRRLNEERDEQRNRFKSSLNNATSDSTNLNKATLVPVPLKPDPRCPTTLTLQVNLNPKDKESGSGSFDTGDPTTTNLYIGNLNPTVTENDLCDIFSKFGALASIKIMWPRTEEERARNRNSGFVAYMSRVDADRALKSLHGMEFRGYELKLGWGKAVPLPKNPVFIPKELIDFMKEPNQSGLPFNAQLHESDVARGYKVPKSWPRPVGQNPSENTNAQSEYQDFIETLQRATVHVRTPQDSELLDRIHETIQCVLKEGPSFEGVILARESNNSNYRFLYDQTSSEHVYYRWKLYSLLHGEDMNLWKTEPFRMFEGGPMWKPPPLNPFEDGMPLELVERLTGLNRDVLSNERPRPARKMQISNQPSADSESGCLKFKGKFGPDQVQILNNILSNLTPSRTSIGHAMLFCINHSDAADEIIECFERSSQLNAPYKVRLAQLFLISDILHNSSAAVTNASFYRKGFQAKLPSMFERLRDFLHSIEDRHRAERFKQKVLSVLNAWSYFHLYESKFLVQLSNIFLDIAETQENQSIQEETATKGDSSLILDPQLDGELVDEQVLAQCLEERGLSLRWYKTLELSDEEESDYEPELSSKNRSQDLTRSDSSKRSGSPATPRDQQGTSIDEKATRFKTSKWELVTDDQEHRSLPTKLISPITTRAVPVKDLSSQKVGSPAYDNSPSWSGDSNG